MSRFATSIWFTKLKHRFVNPIALGKIQWRYYAVYIVIDFFVAFIAWLQFPETRRMSIEEISLVFDYDTKDGRQKALEELRSHPRDAGADFAESLHEDGDLEKGKREVEHHERV